MASDAPQTGQATPKRARRVLVVDADGVLVELLDEWLRTLDIEVIHEGPDGTAPARGYDLAIVDVPFPRRDGAKRIARIANQHPRTPILAVSAAFFPCVAVCGALARDLGVDCVLPKPVAREAVLGAVRRLLHD